MPFSIVPLSSFQTPVQLATTRLVSASPPLDPTTTPHLGHNHNHHLHRLSKVARIFGGQTMLRHPGRLPLHDSRAVPRPSRFDSWVYHMFYVLVSLITRSMSTPLRYMYCVHRSLGRSVCISTRSLPQCTSFLSSQPLVLPRPASYVPETWYDGQINHSLSGP